MYLKIIYLIVITQPKKLQNMKSESFQLAGAGKVTLSSFETKWSINCLKIILSEFSSLIYQQLNSQFWDQLIPKGHNRAYFAIHTLRLRALHKTNSCSQIAILISCPPNLKKNICYDLVLVATGLTIIKFQKLELNQSKKFQNWNFVNFYIFNHF